MTESDDLAEIATVIRTFFDAFTSGPEDEVDVRLDALRAVFLLGARIVKTCGDLTSYDVEEFIEPRRQLLIEHSLIEHSLTDGTLTDGTLTDFREWEVEGRADLFGDVAQHWWSYAKEGVQAGARFEGRGQKTTQLVRTPEGWRISAVAWDDERVSPEVS